VEGLYGEPRRGPVPATLLRRHATTAREHLSDTPTPDGRPFDLFTAALDALAEGGMRVTPA
jgi:hypothetical protein